MTTDSFYAINFSNSSVLIFMAIILFNNNCGYFHHCTLKLDIKSGWSLETYIQYYVAPAGTSANYSAHARDVNYVALSCGGTIQTSDLCDCTS